MDILLESDLKAYQQRRMIKGLETKRQINEALATNGRKPHILAQVRSFFQAVANARKIRVEVHFDYNEHQPKTSGC